jgi:serine protease Do
MRSSKRAGLTAAAVIAAVVAIVSGTKVLAQAAPVRAPRALDALAGRGSEIGVSVRDVDRGEAPPRGAAAAAGVQIDDVTPDGPADKAGLKKGDVVVEFDGEKVRSVRQFIRLVDETPPGRRVAAAVLRGGQRVELNVEPRPSSGIRLLGQIDAARVMRDLGRQFENGFSYGPAPAAPPAPPAPPAPGAPSPPPPPPPAPPAWPDFEGFAWRTDNTLGIRVSALTGQLADYFGAKRGVLVTSVEETSAAHAAGLKAGDVVTALNRTEVSDPNDLRSRIQGLRSGDEFTVDVLREKKTLTLKGKIERRPTHAATRVSL